MPVATEVQAIARTSGGGEASAPKHPVFDDAMQMGQRAAIEQRGDNRRRRAVEPDQQDAGLHVVASATFIADAGGTRL